MSVWVSEYDNINIHHKHPSSADMGVAIHARVSVCPGRVAQYVSFTFNMQLILRKQFTAYHLGNKTHTTA